MRYLHILIIFCVFSIAYGEKIFELNDNGKVNCEKKSYFSALITHDFDKKAQNIKYPLKFNDNTAVISDTTDSDFIILQFNSFLHSQLLLSGDNDITGQENSFIDIIAWDEPDDDMSDYITTLIANLNINRKYSSNIFEKVVGKITVLKKILYSRLEYLNDCVENADANLVTLKESYDITVEGLKEIKAEKESYDKDVTEKKTEIQELNSKIISKEKDLENDPDNEQLQAEITALKSELSVKVSELQNLNNKVYELEKTIKATENLITELKNDIDNYEDTIEGYKNEIPVRTSEVARLNELDLSGSGTDTPDGGYVDNTTTVINKEDEGYNFGEVFGISCISACGIALPTGLIMSASYTEIRLPGGDSIESVSNEPNEINSNLAEQLMPVEAK